MSSDNKSARELKGEVMHDLRKINRDIDDVKGHLSPGRMIDDVLNYRSKKTPRGTLEHLKANPVGTSFLALGTILLAENDRGTIEGYAKEKSSSAYEGARSRASVIRGKMEDAKASIKSRLPKRSPEILEDERPSEFGIRDRANESLRNVRSKIELISDNLKSGKDRAQVKINEQYETAKNLEPLTYVALGAGLGALTGASLPLSDKERDYTDSRYGESMDAFRRDLEKALNESVNIVKSEFTKDFSLTDLDIFFKRRSA